MNISAVVVWYNPGPDFAENVRSYASRMGRVYVIDNSARDNSALLSGVGNAVYVPNFGNRGIAAALNQGCARARADGFDWAMTMDQDSRWEDGALGEYLRLCEEHSGRAVSFGPGVSTREPRRTALQRGWRVLRGFLAAAYHIFRKRRAPQESAVLSVDRLITSGNVISLAAWQDAGKFFEPFFIDEVDHEFCYRLRERGHEILRFPGIRMDHRLGNPPDRAYFFPPLTYHAGVRLFYIYRNCAYERRLHPAYFRKFGYRKQLLRRRLEVILNLRFGELKYIVRGGVLCPSRKAREV